MTELRISWSGLRTHIACKQKGYLHRSGKKPKIQDVRNFFPGTVTDRVVRDWLSDDPYSNPGLMPEMVESIIERESEIVTKEGNQLRWRNLSDRDFVLKECQEAVRLIEPDLERFVLPYDYEVDFSFKAPLKAEHPVTHAPSLITLRGFMDILVRRSEGEWCVYDVKHTRDDYYWKKTKGQLSFYDLAVELLFGHQTVETGLLQPLCKETYKPFVLTEDERTILLKHVLDMANDIWTENFEPNAPIEECTFCDVKHACSRFKAVNSKHGDRRVKLFGGN